MKKNRIILLSIIVFTMIFSIVPTGVPQKGVYTFHGAANDQKILKVRTVNNASLLALFGVNWTDVIEIFGPGAANVGARLKSVVTAVDFDYTLDLTLYGLGTYDACLYTTNNWQWTTGDFAETPDATGTPVTSLYDPTNLTSIVNSLYLIYNVTVQNAGAYLAQLPTPVDQYLGALVWEPKWEAVGNTVVHSAAQFDVLPDYVNVKFYVYLQACTETWTYDTTYGAWIGYKLQDNADNVIYEFSIELPSGAAIPGYELLILLGASAIGIISLTYATIKKKR
ncbi:MAG: hypothetical protein ACFFDY_03845 [Candidatus Thorarchaeota archaeon]